MVQHADHVQPRLVTMMEAGRTPQSANAKTRFIKAAERLIIQKLKQAEIAEVKMPLRLVTSEVNKLLAEFGYRVTTVNIRSWVSRGTFKPRPNKCPLTNRFLWSTEDIVRIFQKAEDRQAFIPLHINHRLKQKPDDLCQAAIWAHELLQYLKNDKTLSPEEQHIRYTEVTGLPEFKSPAEDIQSWLARYPMEDLMKAFKRQKKRHNVVLAYTILIAIRIKDDEAGVSRSHQEQADLMLEELGVA